MPNEQESKPAITPPVETPAKKVDEPVAMDVLLERLTKYESRIDGQSDVINKLKDEIKGLKKPADEPVKPKGSVVEQQVSELDKRIKAFEDEKKAFAEIRTLEEIEKGLIEGGVNPVIAKRTAKTIKQENDSKIRVSGLNAVNIHADDTDETGKPLKDWIKETWLGTDEGKNFIPATKQNPVSDMTPGSAKPNSKLPTYTKSDFASGNYDLKALADKTKSKIAK